MNKVFTENGWADYTFWETEDRKTLKKINKLIEDICRNGNEGIGKPEQTGADDDAGKTNDYRTGSDGNLKASLLLCIDTAA